MRSESEIQSRLRELVNRRFLKFHQQYTRQCPRNCSFNTRLRVTGQGKVGFCQNSAVLKATGTAKFVCNEIETAEQCRVFRCRNTDESVKQEFENILRSPERCGEKFPKLAVLIWVVQDYGHRSRKNRFKQAVKGVLVSAWRLTTFRWW